MTNPTNLLSLRDDTGDTKRIFGPIGPLGFPRTIAIDGTIYIGCHSASDGDICKQTATAFDDLTSGLSALNADMADLINLRTYYVYEGDGGPDVTTFWEKMTEVRLRYLADPGPAGTAVRVSGVPTTSNLVGIDGVATISDDRQRIMPEKRWDWSIPTPLSQGWRIGDTIYLGGQISADMTGGAVFPGDIVAQTKLTLEFIHHVLQDGGHDWADLATMRICYHAGQTPEAGRATLDAILSVVKEVIPAPLPALNAFGVDLLYEGLMLEIDGISIKRKREAVLAPGSATWMQFDDHPVAVMCGKELYAAGLSAPGGASLLAQAEASIDRLNLTLRAAGLGYENLVKLTVFCVPDVDEAAAFVETIKNALADYIPTPGPVVSIVRVKNLPFPGQRVQLDAVAVR
jgi:enamine deaminase RidA (YjgF/YER057c/UK114 family)